MTKGLLALAEFRRLWMVGLLTFVVRWLELLAMALYAYEATGSAFVVAMMTMLRLLPMGLFGAFMGALADRFERRTVLIVTVVASMASTLALGLLAEMEALQVWHLADHRQSGASHDDWRCRGFGAHGTGHVARCRHQ